jgi:hypothetical protein
MLDIIFKILQFLLILFFVALILGIPVMLLWNSLMPELFGLKEITFFQAIGLNLLSGFLLRSSNYSSKSDK